MVRNECSRRAVYWNWNDNGWNVNANEVPNSNRWNDGNEFVSRNYCFSPPLFCGGVLFNNPFFQPPSIRPISSKCFDNSVYFEVGSNFSSQASWIKNFRTSTLEIVFPKTMIFCSVGKYEAIKVNSKTERNNSSIFVPTPRRSTLGKSRRSILQSR